MKSKTLYYLILLTFLATFIPAVHAQTYSVIHSFTGGPGGKAPNAGVTIRENALYGTTLGNPYQNYDCGTAYQLIHSGSNWSFSTLVALGNNCSPYARVVIGPDGHLYGTSWAGGVDHQGTVFKLTPPAGICRTLACYWTVTDVHEFRTNNDGWEPAGGDLIWDQQGNIYGTTYFGGEPFVYGTAFELTPSGNGYTESILHDFSGEDDGLYPASGLVFDNNGNLFGTTEGSIPGNAGNVFELTYAPGVGWTEHPLYQFQNGSDGKWPVGGLIFDSAGNLYGTTSSGGNGGGGTVFELSPSGDTWTFKLLYSFSGPNSYCGSLAALAIDGAGNLYGTTNCDGLYNNGNVFKLSHTQNGWVYSSLYDFTGATDGGGAISNVSIDTDGTLYGTTSEGGDMNCKGAFGSGCGVVWMIKP